MNPFNSSDLKMSLNIFGSIYLIHLIDLPIKLWMSVKTRIFFSCGNISINSNSFFISDFLALNANWSKMSIVVPVKIYLSRKPSILLIKSISLFSGLEAESVDILVIKLLNTMTPINMLQILMNISKKL